MNKDLSRKVGSIGQDNLIAKLVPAAETFGIVIAKTEAETVIERGTLLGRNSEGKYAVYDGKTEGVVPSAILADSVTVGTSSDATAVAYRSGNFSRKHVILPEGYKLTAADEDVLRKYDIIFTDTLKA